MKKKIVFADYIMQSQYEDLIKRMTPKQAKQTVLKAHREYYGKSAKYYGL